MANRILNLSRNCYVKRNQAVRLIYEDKIADWVEPGESLRELTLDEMFQRQANPVSCHLPPTEASGCIFEPPPAKRCRTERIARRVLLKETREFYQAKLSALESRPKHAESQSQTSRSL